MNSIIQRKINVQTGYTKLVSEQMVASVTISCPPSNAGIVYFHGDMGDDVPWSPGEWHDFKSIDLAQIQVKGTAGDVVTIVGGTW
jgi:hypothetical protein